MNRDVLGAAVFHERPGHTQHIYAHCEYAVRFDSRTNVAGYDPDKYLQQYEAAGGDINAMRRAQYARDRDAINAQKRKAYAKRKGLPLPEDSDKIKYRSFGDGYAVNKFFDCDESERGLKARKQSLYQKWLDNLSADERDAISWYTSNGHGDINNYWRKSPGWETISGGKVEDASKQIDSAISKFILKENIVVQRGVEDFHGASLIKGKEWNDIHEIIGMTYREQGYSSTTALYGNRVATTKPYLFEIEVPSGTGRGAYINKLAGQHEDIEYEFLLPRESKFEIIGVEINREPIPPQTVIKMRMIDDG